MGREGGGRYEVSPAAFHYVHPTSGYIVTCTTHAYTQLGADKLLWMLYMPSIWLMSCCADNYLVCQR